MIHEYKNFHGRLNVDIGGGVLFASEGWLLRKCRELSRRKVKPRDCSPGLVGGLKSLDTIGSC